MPRPNPNLRDFWLTREINGEPVRFRILYGGRDSSKSWDAAARAMWLAHKGKLRIMCTRMYQNRIEESVYTTIKKQIHRFGLSEHFDIQRSKIYSNTGSEFLFYGLARNIEEVKSTEGIDILWIEEGQSMTEDMWDILEPTIRKEGSEIWIVFNPDLRTDFIWRKFVENPPQNALVRSINYDENPFLSETSKKTIEQRKELDYQSYEHIYEGVPKEDDEQVIIKRAWVQAAVDAHKKLKIEPKGEKRIGYDVADSGEDKNAITKRYGILVEDTDEWDGGEDELMKSTKRVYNEATSGPYEMIYDSIGVGASVGSKVQEINADRDSSIRYKAFNAGGKVLFPEQEYMPGVKNKDHFKNLKAQSWWLLADRFRTTYNAVTKGAEFEDSEIISINSSCQNLEKLITELSTPKRDYDASGRLKVEKKKDMLKRGVKSPNLADSTVMAFSPQRSTRGFA
jgi:phage terminase large subunit